MNTVFVATWLLGIILLFATKPLIVAITGSIVSGFASSLMIFFVLFITKNNFYFRN